MSTTQVAAWSETLREYIREGWYFRRHLQRYKRYVSTLPRKLRCQACGGRGGETIPILDDGTGPFEYCGWCEGTGLMTPHNRGLWLQWKRSQKK